MDPDMTLKLIREAFASQAYYQDHPELAADAGNRAASLFDDLDEWLLSGGFFPRERRS